jgi:hypothetical protein
MLHSKVLVVYSVYLQTETHNNIHVSRRTQSTFAIISLEHYPLSHPSQFKQLFQLYIDVNAILQVYVGMLISLWLFLFAAQPKEFFFSDGLKKLEHRSHKCMKLKGKM